MVEQEEAKARLGLTRHREQPDSPGNVSEVSTGASFAGRGVFCFVCLWAPLHAIGEQAWASGPSRPGPTRHWAASSAARSSCLRYSLCGDRKARRPRGARRPVSSRCAREHRALLCPAPTPFPSPQGGGPPAAREHSVHFISDYRFLNIIKSLACSGGSVSQSVGSYFSTSLRKTKGEQDGQTDRRGLGGGGEAKGRHARKTYSHAHKEKSQRNEGQRCGAGGTREATTFKGKRQRKRNWAGGSEAEVGNKIIIIIIIIITIIIKEINKKSSK